MSISIQDLIFDWNRPSAGEEAGRRVELDDETLRDGLQSPSAHHPSLAGKIQLLHLMAELGIGAVDVGLPGAGFRAAADVEALCREIAGARLPIAPNCAARTTLEDIAPALEIMERVGFPVEIMLFLGSSPIRCRVEGWPVEELLRRVELCVTYAVARGAAVTFVTEDTSRSRPGDLRRLFSTAVRAGAGRVCLADTAGHATPAGAARLVEFAREVVVEAGGPEIGIDWHGHNDRGLAVANALAAAAAGASRLHGTLLGVGERVGNPPMEQLLVNLRMLGWGQPRLERLMDYVRLGSELLGIGIPPGAPVVGRDAFRTSTGVHAAALVKAASKGDAELVDLVYSTIPASWMGREQVIDVGPMSGGSNVRHWLLAHGYECETEVVERLFAAAKLADGTLSDEELHALVRSKAAR
ncbi:MAG: 2-isopropylmalate synthase [Acidobacteriota bacterium]